MSETVEQARGRYLRLAELAAFWARDCLPDCPTCPTCQFVALLIDAASLSLDLAVAEAHPAEPPLSMVAY